MRKPHVQSDVEDIIEAVRSVGIMDVSSVAEGFDISTGSARRKLDAGVERGELIRDEYDEEGHRLHFEHWRYGSAE